MQEVIFDANVVSAYFYEDIKQAQDPTKTGSPMKIFSQLGIDLVTYVDNEDHIMLEWKNVVDPEWFNIWYTDLMINGKLHEHSISLSKNTLTKIKSELLKLGFPLQGSKDFWYIKLLLSIKSQSYNTFIHFITEDIDFYDPTKKSLSGSSRTSFIENKKGKVLKLLKNEKIDIFCLSNY